MGDIGTGAQRIRHVAPALLALTVLWSIGIVHLTAADSPPTGKITVQPTADVYVDSEKRNQNFGSETTLLVDHEPVYEAYIMFDVTGITGTVTSATLRLYVTNESVSGGSVTVVPDTNWSESAVTYANRPAIEGAVLDTLEAVERGQWVEFDVSEAVTDDGRFSLGMQTSRRDGVDYASRESNAPPQLVVTYESSITGSDITPPTVAITSPADGAVVTEAGSITIEAAASDDVGVATVEFYDNGTYVTTEDSGPFAYTWTLDATDNGTHAWTVKATDAARNSTVSEPVTVTVDITSDGGTDPTGDVITARVETLPVHHSGDAADDPAFWIHPLDPLLSTVIGTDKLGGLAVYDLAGVELYYYDDVRPNNVDVRGDIVTASDRDSDSIMIYLVDPLTRALVDVQATARDTGIGVAGLCMYESATGLYVFVGDSSGTVKQFRLFETGDGTFDYEEVRRLSTGSTTEGCVADDEHAYVYIAEEDEAIWQYRAEPDAGSDRVMVDDVSGGHLTADIEGLAIYDAGAGTGYLIASSQGDNTFAVYDRVSLEHIDSFQIEDGAIDGVTYTDGIDVSSTLGLFAAQDNDNDGDHQNFKLVTWNLIAAPLGLAR